MENLLLDFDVRYNAKPEPVPYNYRASYKVSQLCIILSICGHKQSCSLIKLNMLSYALFSKNILEQLEDFILDKSDYPIVRFDPSVNRALCFGIAYGLFMQAETGKYALSLKGVKYAEKIISDGKVMLTEIPILKKIGKKLTDKRINELVKLWSCDNA